MLVFGPVPSRRLGQSLGINNIPPKTCSYSCVYCQIGRTNHMKVKRSAFYKPEMIYAQVKQKMSVMGGKRVDYMTFVPDGEPTLDINLGRHIDLLRPFGTRIAVITNASLLWMDDVKEDLLKADWVSVKIDAVTHDIWKMADRPHGSLELSSVLQGVADFAQQFEGRLVTETMLIGGLNDIEADLKETAERIKCINPDKAYILVPTRPPAETGVIKPTAEALRNAYDIFRQKEIQTECIAGDEGDSFYFTDDFVDDLLSILAVHPVKEDVILNWLKKRGMDESVLNQLIDKQMLSAYEYEGKRFFKRNL